MGPYRLATETRLSEVHCAPDQIGVNSATDEDQIGTRASIQLSGPDLADVARDLVDDEASLAQLGKPVDQGLDIVVRRRNVFEEDRRIALLERPHPSFDHRALMTFDIDLDNVGGNPGRDP